MTVDFTKEEVVFLIEYLSQANVPLNRRPDGVQVYTTGYTCLDKLHAAMEADVAQEKE